MPSLRLSPRAAPLLLAGVILIAGGIGAAEAQSRHGAPGVSRSVGAPPHAPRGQRHFQRADLNRDGFVSRREYLQWYGTYLRRRSPLTWRYHAARVFNRADASGDGLINASEFANSPLPAN